MLNQLKRYIIWLAPIIFLCIALFEMPYGYYQILRWAVCGCAAYIAYQRYQEQESWDKFVVIFVAIAVLYNPIGAIHLFKEAWMILNVLTVAVFGYGWWKLRGKEKVE